MNFYELMLIAIGLSMDAFAVTICIGLTMTKTTIKKSLIIGLYFGIFQAVMLLIGYLIATQFTDMIISYAPWVVFVLLCFLGGKMIIESFKKEGHLNRNDISLKPTRIIPLAFATSIDAIAIGLSFAFLKVSIIPAISLISITTLVISMLGVKSGNIFGSRFCFCCSIMYFHLTSKHY
jgi:putative Mn2+ efflux pump MntP